MKQLGLLLVSGVLLAGCASTTPAAAPATTTTDAKPSLPTLTSAQISALNDNLRAVDPAAVEGSFDKAQAVCLQIADGAHGEGFLRGVATRFGTDASKGQALVDAVKSAGVCG
jgi:pectin methylesterase-like acyl-CoA thioesterase